MRCPICQAEELERENGCIYDGTKEQPIADYICEVCGAHFQWRKGERGLIIFHNPKDNVPLELNV